MSYDTRINLRPGMLIENVFGLGLVLEADGGSAMVLILKPSRVKPGMRVGERDRYPICTNTHVHRVASADELTPAQKLLAVKALVTS